MRQWACGCTNSSVPCSLSPAATQTVLVDETGYDITPLIESEWVYGTVLNNLDSVYFKFDLQYDSARPCPIVILDTDTDLGTLSTLVSNIEIPNSISRIWYSPYYGKGTFVICPSNPNMTYGTYYITLSNQFGNVYNSFRLRYRTVNSPSCLTNVPVPPSQPDTVDSEWIMDGIEVSGAIEDGIYVHYRLMTSGPCTNVSASVYSWLGLADLDIFTSATSPYPAANDKTSFQWHGTLEGDDYVNFYYCNPNMTATTNTFYFGIRGVTPGLNNFSFFASSYQWASPYPLSQYGMVQYTSALSYGATPMLSCSDRVYTCGFTPYTSCDLDRAYDCCYLFSPLPATSLVQTVWPWSEWDESIGVLATDIPWGDSSPIQRGKLAWRLYLSRATNQADGNGTSEILSYSDPSTCTLSLNTNILDSTGKPIDTSISFTKKQKNCDYHALKAVRQNMKTLSDSLVGQTDIVQLGLQQTRLVIASLDPTYSACQDFVDGFTASTSETSSEDVSFCPFVPGSNEWLNDPCCNPIAAIDTCCLSRPVFRVSAISRSVDSNKIKQTCRSPQCVEGSITEWAELSRANADERKGCAATFNKASSLDALGELTRFIDGCRIELVGMDLMGSHCSSDSDCSYGASCNPYTLRCNHTDDNIIDCMAHRMDETTATILFNTWGLSEAVTVPILISELNSRIKTVQCSGSASALKHRNGYFWSSYIDGCSDTCSLDNRAPFCFDRTSNYCVIDPDCDGAQVDGSCYRFWSSLSSDSVGCLNDHSCNWMDCPNDGSDCQNACENPIPYSSHVCVDCSATSGKCLAVDSISDEPRCNQGLCSTNSTATSLVDCHGKCSIGCSNCDDSKSTCESNGICTDSILIKDALYALQPSGNFENGACLYPSEYDVESNYWICAGTNDFLVPSGCVNVSASDQPSCPTQWYQYANNEMECMDLNRYGCYDANSESWLHLNESQCLACLDSQGYQWISQYEWQIGEWTDGLIQPLQWIERQYQAPNVMKSAIDYFLLFSMIKSAVTTQFAFSYYTEAQCRYSLPLQLIESTLCDCASTADDPKVCFASTSNVAMGQGRACPFLESSFSTRTVSVHILSTSIPSNAGCQVLSLSFTPPSQFKLDSYQAVSQALFRDSPTNVYWVVINQQNAYIGQIISGGVKIDIPMDLADNLTICIEPDPAISIANVASERIISMIDTSTSEITPLSSISYMDPNGKVCAKISKTGTYFASAVVKNYNKQTNRVSIVQYRVGAAIYLACFAFGVVQLILLLRDWEQQRILAYKITFISIILFNDVIRAVYVLLPANTFRGGMDSIQFIVFELPTFLYFSVFTVIIYMWLLVVMKAMLWARRGEVNRRERQMRLGFILANTLMYIVFVIFIYLIAILPAKQKASPCFIGSSDSKSSSVTYRIKLAYWIFQFVIVFLVSIGFTTGAFMLSRTFWKSGGGNVTARQTAKKSRYSMQIAIISSVGLTCMVFLLIRSALFLWAAKTGHSLNVIVFVILEVIPQTMLLFYVHPFQCFREEGRSSTSSSRLGHVSSYQSQGPISSRVGSNSHDSSQQ
jgi:hypothetical protein